MSKVICLRKFLKIIEQGFEKKYRDTAAAWWNDSKRVLKIGTFTDSFFFTTVDRKPKIDNDWIGTADLWYR